METSLQGSLTETKQRIAYLDYLRIISMVGVVIMHASYFGLLEEIDISWNIINLLTSFSFIAVPIFFMISGAVLFDNAKTASVSYTLKKRIPKLIIPLFFWSMVAVLPGYLNSEAMANGFNIIGYLKWLFIIPSQIVTTHLWFMYYLIPLYLISPFIKIMIDHMNKTHIKYLLLLWIAVIIMNTVAIFLPESYKGYVIIDFISKTYFLNGYLAYSILGYYLHKSDKTYSNKLLLSILIADLLLITIDTYFLTIANGAFTQRFQSVGILFNTILAIVVFLLLKQNMNKLKNSKLLSYLSSLSFSVYLMHNIFIGVFLSYFNFTSAFDTFILIVITIFVCIFTNTILASIKPFCYIVSGLSFEAASKSCNLQFLIGRLKNRRS